MVKPEFFPVFKWSEAISYLEEKYDFDREDVAGRWENGTQNPDVDFFDFTEWMQEAKEAYRGVVISFSNEDLDYDEEWAKLVIELILKEFGEDENRTCYFEIDR